MSALRILLHDYPGHAFPIQLSRELARRGHQVLHLSYEAFQSPKGPLARRADDPPGLVIEGVPMGEGYSRYDFVRRGLMELRYGQALARRAHAFRPDVVFGGNGPLDPQKALLGAARRVGAGFVFWVQDFYGLAIDRILSRKLGLPGRIVGARYRALERALWRASDHLIAITEDFRPLLEAGGVPRGRVSVIENWAPLDDLAPAPRENAWAEAHGLAGKRVLLYSGTLGLKHDPSLLAALAEAFAERDDVRVVVITQGLGRDMLEDAKRARGLDRLVLLDFQPYEVLPQVLASADALLVLLEHDAAVYSVPSKVLSYFCAGRAVLGAIPSDNLAARLIGREQAGLVVAPGEASTFVAAARSLLDDCANAARLGANGRAYAERAFDIGAITDRVEAILGDARRDARAMIAAA